MDIKQLNGSLKSIKPGARGLEKAARNPDCLKIQALTVACISPSQVAKEIYGLASQGQSPFAMMRGITFENNAMDIGAGPLLAILREKNKLSITECKFCDIPSHYPGTDPESLNKRELLTKQMLLKKIHLDPDAPNLVIHPRLSVKIAGSNHTIEPDFIVAADSDNFYRIGEAKSYSDRAGETDDADIQSASRQMAVGLHAMRYSLNELRVNPIPSLELKGELILTRPGSLSPTLRTRPLDAEFHSIEHFLNICETLPKRLQSLLSPGEKLDNRVTLDKLPTSFRENCRNFCPLATDCRTHALNNSSPIILGQAANESLAVVQNMLRATELMEGTGAPPKNEQEQQLALELQQIWKDYQREAPNV